MTNRQSGTLPAFALEFSAWMDAERMSYRALAEKVGTNRVSIRHWKSGAAFPRDKFCERLYALSNGQLNSFGPGRSDVRLEHVESIPYTIKEARRSKYQKNAAAYREAALRSWRRRAQANKIFVSPEELAELRANPRCRKEVCRNCGQVLKDIGPHLGHCLAGAMKSPEYRAMWNFTRTRNATRSIESNRKQSLAMIRKRHRPPRWTRRLLPAAQRASLLTNVPGSARLEERLDARGRRLGSRPSQWKSNSAGGVVTDAKVAELRLSGKGSAEIASLSDLSLTSVYLRLRRMGFPRRSRVWTHGEPVGAKHVLALATDFKLTPDEIAKLIGLSVEWVRRLLKGKSTAWMSPAVAKRILAARERLIRSLRFRPAAGRRGGRPKQLTSSDELAIPTKCDLLRGDLKTLRHWIREHSSQISTCDLWDGLCAEFRFGRFSSIQLWPQFFDWLRTDYDSQAFRQGNFVPKDLAVAFLASDYGASESVIASLVSHRSLAAVT